MALGHAEGEEQEEKNIYSSSSSSDEDDPGSSDSSDEDDDSSSSGSSSSRSSSSDSGSGSDDDHDREEGSEDENFELGFWDSLKAVLPWTEAGAKARENGNAVVALPWGAACTRIIYIWHLSECLHLATMFINQLHAKLILIEYKYLGFCRPGQA